VLSARALRKSFSIPGGKLTVLDGLDFSLGAGRSASIRGESGSGKSTLLHLFAGLERPDGGGIFWEGDSLATWGPRRLALERGRRLGLVFQAYHLVAELDALENLLLAARIAGRPDAETRERARRLLDRVGLAGREKQLPARMSGGERQRVAVARAILNRPRVLLADEPTGNLDEKTGEATMDLLLELVREEGLSLVLVTHNPRFADGCSEKLFLREGYLHRL
jgi:predicted ABC-type transport system involved in lysophospholipase L1 biosynthesis ATPase subunit